MENDNRKKEINVQIGMRLQSVRESNGYTQENFAETLDVGVEHYRKLELGVCTLHPEKMLVLYNTYMIDPTYLITGDNNQNFNLDLYLTNCGQDERNSFFDRVLVYMRKLLIREE